MDRKQFHSSRRQFLQISSLLTIGTVTAPIAQALLLAGNTKTEHLSHLKDQLDREGIRSLDFDSHLFPLRNYRIKPDPISITPSLF